MKIRTIIFLTLFLFSVIPVTLMGCLLISNYSDKMEEVLTEELDSVSKVQMVAVDTFIESRREVLTILADFNYVKDAIKNSIDGKLDNDTRAYIDDMLVSRKNIKSFVNSLTIVDKNYEIVGSSGDYEGKNAGKLELINHDYLQGDFRIGNIYTKENSDVELIACYKGVYDNKELIGFVIEELLVDHFKVFTNSNLFAEEAVYIVDGFNNLISMTDEAKHNTHILEEHFRDQSDGKCEYVEEGSKYVTYYSKINYTDWYTVASTNLSARYTTINHYKTLLYFILLIVIAVVFVALLFVTRQISTPINRIVNALNKVTKTDDYSSEEVREAILGYINNNELIYEKAYSDIELKDLISTRDDYMFVGWYSDAEFINEVTKLAITEGKSEYTLYAKWVNKLENAKSLALTALDEFMKSDEIVKASHYEINNAQLFVLRT